MQAETSEVSGEHVTCTKDCPEPQEGYVFIGCSITLTNGREGIYLNGSPVPKGQVGNGYVYVSSKRYDEIISCNYWNKDIPVPPSFAELLGRELRNVENKETVSEVESLKLESNILKKALGRYNNNIGDMPGPIQSLLGNENTHVFYTDDVGELFEYAAVTEKGLMVQISHWLDKNQDGSHDVWAEEGRKTTMEVYFDEGIMNWIAGSDNPKAAFLDAWGRDIRYNGLTFTASVKETAMNLAMWVAGFFIRA